jgi:hypothetical protein
MSHFRHWGIAYTKKVGIIKIIFSPMVILGSVKEVVNINSAALMVQGVGCGSARQEWQWKASPATDRQVTAGE